MKSMYLSLSILLLSGCSAQSQAKITANETVPYQSVLAKTQWHHGAVDCDTDKSANLDVYQHDESSFILRQNKCLTFEAPFIYVLVGSETILVLDSGALDEAEYSVYKDIETLLTKHLGKAEFAARNMLLAHSHGHSDHYRGDDYFKGQAKVTVIEPKLEAVQGYFGFDNWPSGEKTIDLGDRLLTVMATPGHQAQAISIYDSQTQWLMTGDTLYPGLVYVKDWHAYRSSIDRMANFADEHQVSAIMGAHIEMQRSGGNYYPIGSQYQPDEAALDLSVSHLNELNNKLKESADEQELNLGYVIIKPMGFFQKTLTNIVTWLRE
jgi:hydroxyacylglutathione hydrolase